MTQPHVSAVMLVNGRPEMVKRAVKSFHAQTYPNKSLLVFDSGEVDADVPAFPGVEVFRSPYGSGRRPIGELRNLANAMVLSHSEILAHWDSDDWNAPNRIQDQVDLLLASEADMVGYNQMLFWKTRESIERDILSRGTRQRYDPLDPMNFNMGEAWLYTSQNPELILGTSMCYWRKTWEKVPFRNRNEGEDHQWQLDLCSHRMKVSAASAGVSNPLMIASVHGGNTCSRIEPGKVEWKRMASMDSKCAEVMKL